MELRLPTRGGALTLRADSYALDLTRAVLTARDVKLIEPSGDELASAGVLFVRFELSGGSVGVTARDAECLVARDAQGRFRILDFLPEKTAEAGETAYSVELRRIRLNIADGAGGEKWRKSILIETARIEGFGEAFVAEGTLRDGSGSVRGVLRVGPKDGITADIRLSNMEITPYFERFRAGPEGRAYPELAQIEAAKVLASGPLSATAAPEQPAAFSGSLVLDGENVRYGEYAFSTARFRGKLSDRGADGSWSAIAGTCRAKGEGRIAWSPDVTLSTLVAAQAPSERALPAWLRRAVPKDVLFVDGGYEGTIAYHPIEGFTADGSATLKRGAFGKETAADMKGTISLSGDGWMAAVSAGKWRGNPVTAALMEDARGGQISGFVQASGVNLSSIARLTGLKELSGKADLAAVLSGTLAKPEADIRAKGYAQANLPEGRKYRVEDLQARAKWRGKMVAIEQFAGMVAGGRVFASGNLDVDTQRLDISAFLGGADLSEIHADLKGSAAAHVLATGTLKRPKISGKVECYGLDLSDTVFPLATMSLRADRDHIEVYDVEAGRAAARIQGQASWKFGSDALTGSFSATGVELADFFGNDFAGVLSVPKLTLGGTLASPRAEISAEAQDVVAYGTKLDRGMLTGRFGDDVLALDSGVFASGQGAIAVTGSYDVRAQRGAVKLEASNLDIKAVAPSLPMGMRVGGSLGGSLTASFEGKQLASLGAKGDVTDLTVNPTLLGSGSWETSFADGQWKGKTQIGQIERYIEVSDILYDPTRDSVEGIATAYGMPLHDLFLALRPLFTSSDGGKTRPALELSPEVLSQLDGLEGNLDAAIRVSGSAKEPNVSIDSVSARNLVIGGASSGSIALKAERSGHTWNVGDLLWTNGPSRLTAAGTIQEKGEISIDGNVDNISTSWLRNFVPDLGVLDGQIGNVAFVVSGPTQDPVIAASLVGTFFENRAPEGGVKMPGQDAAPSTASTADRGDTRLRLNLYDITLSNSGAKVAGSFSYLGFKGDVRGSLPFAFPFLAPSDQKLDLTIDMANRPLKELRDLIPSLDSDRTEGEVGGRITIGGTVSAPQVNGWILTRDAKLGIDNVRTELKKVDMSAKIAGTEVTLGVKGESSAGGSLDGSLKLILRDLVEDTQAWLQYLLGNELHPPDNALSGQVDLFGFTVSEDRGASGGKLRGASSGRLILGGEVRSPRISTQEPIVLTRIDAKVPDEFQTLAKGFQGPINPLFAVDFRIASASEPAAVAVSNGAFDVDGNGRLSGPLSALQVASNLIVRKGAIRLPNARVTIEEGGSARFLYAPDADGIARPRLDIDLQGKTGVTSAAITGIVERYDAYLHLTGNMMAEGELRITARSDPPGLSEAQILGILGQREVLESLGPKGGDFQRQVQSALTNIAFPMLLDPFTERIAKDIGLEYLSLDYNAFEGASLTAGKTFGRGFAAQYRRQVSDPLDGIVHFDLRLTYRPFRKGGLLRNVYLSAGADHLRPWKISIEYGGRF